MFERESHLLLFMQGYGDSLLADIDDADFCKQPVAGMNHPAWIVGHLAFVNDKRGSILGGEHRLADWGEAFGRGSTPSARREDYPAKAELIDAWHDANRRLIATVAAADPAIFAAAPEEERLAQNFPTVGHFISFVMTSHMSIHIGQLSAWRRADGRGLVF